MPWEKSRRILRKQALKIGVGGTIAVAVLLILGPVLNLTFANNPSISISISIAILTAVGVLLSLPVAAHPPYIPTVTILDEPALLVSLVP